MCVYNITLLVGMYYPAASPYQHSQRPGGYAADPLTVMSILVSWIVTRFACVGLPLYLLFSSDSRLVELRYFLT